MTTYNNIIIEKTNTIHNILIIQTDTIHYLYCVNFFLFFN